MLKRISSYYYLKLPHVLVYMIQQVDYNPWAFLKWVLSLPNIKTLQKRGSLHTTLRAQLLIIALYITGASIVIGICVVAISVTSIALVLLLVVPIIVIFVLTLLTGAAWMVIEKPRRYSVLKQAQRTFEDHSAIKIAVLGSYGKTTMKELLSVVLSAEKHVAITPGNKNVALSHARWIGELSGSEEVLVIEYGEESPGDIAYFAQMTHPDIAVVTGLAPNHLESYKTLEALTHDIVSIQDYVEPKNLFYNAGVPVLTDKLGGNGYSHRGVADWKVTSINVSASKLKFTMNKGKQSLEVTSQLIGRHQVGPIVVAIAIALQLGVSKKAAIEAIANLAPYEHRMSVRNLHGATVIDDTYNGNIEGIKAGLALLSELSAKRKIYVTPGLVEQGVETKRVHIEIGRHIAQAKPDVVVLMDNSVRRYMQQGIEDLGFSGKVIIEDEPLKFYTGLDYFVKPGDIVLMQNDWTDNYR